MKLFYAPQSPFARKVRIAAIELGIEDGIELEYAEVVPGRPNTAYAISHNPLRKIPALLIESGETLYDSTVICEYFDTLAGGNVLVPRDAPRRWRVLTNHALAQGMCESVIQIRYETSLRPEALRWPTWVDDHWNKIDSGLDWFERNDNELGGALDLAQIGLGCLLGYVDFRWPDRRWREQFPKLGVWFEQLDKRPSFAATKPASPPAL